MANSYFRFKQFTVHQDRCAMKVTTDGCLFGAWVVEQLALRQTQGDNQVRSALDIGTGTGLLSLMLAQKTDSPIDAIEIDKDAFEQASKNVIASPWTDRVNVNEGDVKEYAFTQQYDVIISNPPFYEKELKGDDAKKNLAHHNEGLLLPELLDIIKKNLAPRGSFFLLLPYKRNEEIKKLLFDNNMTAEQLVFVHQTDNHNYFRIMLEGKLSSDNASGTTIEEISIKNGGSYSPAFQSLLKDYYLHL